MTAKVGTAQQRSRGVFSTHVPAGKRCAARDATLVTCVLLGRETLRSTELPQHALAAYRDLLNVVPLANRESYQALRAYVREWALTQRTYDDRGRNTTPDTSAPMDFGQVNGTIGKGKKGEKGAGECGYCGKWAHKKTQCKKQ